MRPVIATLGLFLAATAALPAAPRTTDLELVLAVDASSSVDIGDYALQLRGIANAFRDREVQEAISGGSSGRIAVTLVIWAEPGFDKLKTGWHSIATGAEAEAFAKLVETLPRRQFGGTGIGEGIETSLAELASNGIEASRQVIDVSGDGRESASGSATLLPDARRMARERNVIINGLAITQEDPDLVDYYDQNLRAGPGSFVIRANTFLDFADAMKIKLLREISGARMADAPVSDGASRNL
jgi:hypothetical protein